MRYTLVMGDYRQTLHVRADGTGAIAYAGMLRCTWVALTPERVAEHRSRILAAGGTQS